MSNEEKNKGPTFVYCHTCKELIAKCAKIHTAFATEKAHRKSIEDEHCEITTGRKWYFDRVYPSIQLEPKVIISVHAGVASVEKSFVDVEIRDYDIEDTEDVKKDSDGDFYRVM
jgi:hypothetical protein